MVKVGNSEGVSKCKTQDRDGFCGRLRECRQLRGLTLQALADAAGTTKAYVWQLETKASPRLSADLLDRLCVALEVSREFLRDGKRPADMSDEEERMLLMFRAMQPVVKARALRIMAVLGG